MHPYLLFALLTVFWSSLLCGHYAFAVPPSIACVDSVRSHTEPQKFKRLYPCPSTGQRYGACPGYVIDHVISLCSGGADSVDNMAWQTVAEARLKDKWENTEHAHNMLELCKLKKTCFVNWPR